MTKGKPVIATWWPVVPCVLSVVLFFLWVFDVGHGPFSGERFGTAGEWGSAVGTTGAVAVSLHLLIADRRKARAEAREAEIARLVEKVHGHKPIADLSLNEIPVVWVMTELGPGGTDSSRTRYGLSFELLNGSSTPLLNLRARVELMGNFRPQDHDDWMEAMQSLQDAGDDDGLRMWLDAYPYPVKVCEQTLVGVHQRVSSVIEAEIDAEQYRTGGSFAVTWEVGTMGFEHRVGRDGRAHRQARPIIESRRPRTS